jgi:hypothetical protein
VFRKKHWARTKGNWADVNFNSHEAAEPLPKELDQDTRLLKENGRFFLLLNYQVDNVNQFRKPMVALERGISTFMAGFDPDGDGFKIGKGDDKVFALWLRTDKVKQHFATEKMTRTRRKRAGLRRVRLPVFQRISNMVTGCHYKKISFLIGNYDSFLIPWFNIKEMISNEEIPSVKQFISSTRNQIGKVNVVTLCFQAPSLRQSKESPLFGLHCDGRIYE